MKTIRNFLSKPVPLWLSCVIAVLSFILTSLIIAATRQPAEPTLVVEQPTVSAAEAISDMRAVAAHWDEPITGAMAWLVNPAREHGVTADDILALCDYLEEHFVD